MENIKNGSDPIIIVIGAEPGAGKTTLACTAKNGIILDFDKGMARSSLTSEYKRFGNWEEVIKLDYSTYDTIEIDTLGRMADEVSFYLRRENPALYCQKDGTLSLKGFGKAKDVMRSFFDSLRKDIVIITQLKKEVDKNQDIAYFMDVQGSIKDFIRQCADAIGIIVLDSKGNRILDFTDPRFRKDSHDFSGGKPIPLPTPDKLGMFLTDLIEKCRQAKINMGNKQDNLLKLKATFLSAMKTLQNEEEKEALRKKIESTYQGGAPAIKDYLFERLAKAQVGAVSNPIEKPIAVSNEQDILISETKELLQTAQNGADCDVVLARIQGLGFSETTINVLNKLLKAKREALNLDFDRKLKKFVAKQ